MTAANTRESPVHAAGQRRPHLAAGTDNQHVAIETSREFNVRLGRARQNVLELRFGANLCG